MAAKILAGEPCWIKHMLFIRYSSICDYLIRVHHLLFPNINLADRTIAFSL